MAKNKNNQSVWSNRIHKIKPTFFEKIGNSIDVDKRLFKEDIIKDAGHCPHDEEPEKTNKLINEFIQEIK